MIRYFTIAAVVIVTFFFLATMGSIVENVNADEITVIQSPGGDLSVYTTPGYKAQWFGSVTTYKKRGIYTFDKETNTKMRFNDGAHGYPTGSIQFELPLDDAQMVELHTKFGSQQAIEAQLIKTVVDKAIYMTGPLMSSKESYAERRNELISNVEDQVAHGVYRTRQKEERIEDPITKEWRTVTVVEIVQKDGIPARQEDAVLRNLGIKTFNFSISELSYDEKVEAQITAQQQAIMDVQTAQAESKKAEQRALTVAKEGEASAAKARWEQEAIKAAAVTEALKLKEVAELAAEKAKTVALTEAEQRRDVAKLDAEAADQYRIGQLRKAEGDATYKREMMKADGALGQKLTTYERVMDKLAYAIANRKVPVTVIGSNDNGSDSSVKTFMDLQNAKVLKDLSLDMGTNNQ